MTGGTETRALIRWKECAEITARLGQRWCDKYGAPDVGKSRTQKSGSHSGGQCEGAKKKIRRQALGEGGCSISKCHVEEGLPYSGGDSEDRIRTEGQRCREGKSLATQRGGLLR